MDLSTLENKLKNMAGLRSGGDKKDLFSPTSQSNNNPFGSDDTPALCASDAVDGGRPVSVTKKINEITDEDVSSYSEKVIPNWKDLQAIYEGQWQKEKEKFQTHLKANFAALVERFASGKQELFQLVAPERRERLYIEAFLELFESGYAPHVGDVERIANKRVRKLYITLPNNYSSIY